MHTNFYVYILKCNDGSYYVEHTDDIEKRLQEHQAQRYSCFTTRRLPVQLMHTSQFPTRDEAINAERQIKGWTRRKKEALIAGDLLLLAQYSKKIF